MKRIKIMQTFCYEIILYMISSFIMENQQYSEPKDNEMEPVSRKTNEEIDSDEEGNLIIHQEYTRLHNQSSTDQIAIDDDEAEHLED